MNLKSLISRALFASLEGKGGEDFRKKEGANGKNREFWEGRLWRV